MELFEKYPVHIYNSIKRKKEKFVPIKSPFVGFYVCGPTVYGDPHLGHARSFTTFDVVFRYLKYLGYKVRYVRNITDVGHLEHDADEGEDKIAKKARIEQVEPMEVVQQYTVSFHLAMQMLNNQPPSIEPSASGHIIEQIELIRRIMDNGYAYEKDGSVYFDMDKYLESYKYGELSGKVVEDLMSGSRSLQGQIEKKNPIDFALWKKATPEHIMQWPSPWGNGFPGWHLECTAMSSKYLGVPFDIHGGGLDLQFPHHEGEIAQANGAFGCSPVNYWMHSNLLTLEGQKMAKSKGNFINLEEMFTGDHRLLEKSYSPMTVRFFILQSHYGSQIDFSNEALQAAEKGYQRLMKAASVLEGLEYAEGSYDEELNAEVSELCSRCFEFMSDDFNSARLLSVLFEMSTLIFSMANDQIPVGKLSKEAFEELKMTFNGFVFDVLGLVQEENKQHDKLTDVVQWIISLRKQARENKNFVLSDKIRDELAGLGVKLKDGKNGITTFDIE